MIVAIYAFECQYYGLHGISKHIIEDVDNIEHARELAVTLSKEVMEENYQNIIEGFQNEALEEGYSQGSEDFYDYIDECISDNVEYQIWEVVDKYANDQTMEEDFYNDMDDFVEKHCREIN